MNLQYSLQYIFKIPYSSSNGLKVGVGCALKIIGLKTGRAFSILSSNITKIVSFGMMTYGLHFI